MFIVACWNPALQTIVVESNINSLGLSNKSALQAYRVHLVWQVKMPSFFLIYDSAQWTIGKVYVWCEFAFAVALLGWFIVSSGVELCRNEGKCVRKAFQGAGMTSRCIYHLLVLPLLSCWARWVTHYSLALISSSLLSFSHTSATLSISVLPFFIHSSHLSLSFLLLLGLWNSVNPWRMSWVWKPLIGINECTFRSFSNLLGGAKSGLKKEAGSGKETERVGSEKRDKRERDRGRPREIVHQGALSTLLGRYLNLNVCDAVLPCFINLLSSLSREKSPQKTIYSFSLMWRA